MIVARPYQAGDAAAIAPHAFEEAARAPGPSADRRARRSWEAWTIVEDGRAVACGGVAQARDGSGRAWGMASPMKVSSGRRIILQARAVLARAPMQVVFGAARCDLPEAVRLMWRLGFRPQEKFVRFNQPYWLYARFGGG